MYTVTVAAGFDNTLATFTASSYATYSYANPCISTTIAWLTLPDALLYAVTTPLAATETVDVNDNISIATTTSNQCGAFTYSVSDSSVSATSALATTELTISSSGLISVLTSNLNTVGTHTVTVTASLSSYPLVTTSVTFSLTIECVPTSVSVVA